MMFSINNSDKPDEKMYQNFPEIAFFIVETCKRQNNPTVSYLKTCLFLLYDAANFYWKTVQYRDRVQNILDSEQVKEIVSLLFSIKNRSELAALMEYIRDRDNMKAGMYSN